jgi:hypothetical protein
MTRLIFVRVALVLVLSKVSTLSTFSTVRSTYAMRATLKVMWDCSRYVLTVILFEGQEETDRCGVAVHVEPEGERHDSRLERGQWFCVAIRNEGRLSCLP